MNWLVLFVLFSGFGLFSGVGCLWLIVSFVYCVITCCCILGDGCFVVFGF